MLGSPIKTKYVGLRERTSKFSAIPQVRGRTMFVPVMMWKLLAALQKVSLGTNGLPAEIASWMGCRPWRMHSVWPKSGRPI